MKLEYFLTVFYDVPNDTDSLYVKLHPINQETILPSPRSSSSPSIIMSPTARPASTPIPSVPLNQSPLSRPQSTVGAQQTTTFSPIPPSFSFNSIFSAFTSSPAPATPPATTPPPTSSAPVVSEEDFVKEEVRKAYSTATYNKTKWASSKANERPGFAYINSLSDVYQPQLPTRHNRSVDQKVTNTEFRIVDCSLLSRSDRDDPMPGICCKELFYEVFLDRFLTYILVKDEQKVTRTTHRDRGVKSTQEVVRSMGARSETILSISCLVALFLQPSSFYCA